MPSTSKFEAPRCTIYASHTGTAPLLPSRDGPSFRSHLIASPMEYVLTPLVTRFLRQYVKRSAEGSGSNLKVRANRCGWRQRHPTCLVRSCT